MTGEDDIKGGIASFSIGLGNKGHSAVAATLLPRDESLSSPGRTEHQMFVGHHYAERLGSTACELGDLPAKSMSSVVKCTTSMGLLSQAGS